LSKLSNS